MKKTKIIYWIITGIFCAFMVFSSIPDIMCVPDAVALVHDQMGFPVYMIPFLGVAKILGVIGILIPGFRLIKEWSYAGIAFDLIGATYAMIAIGTPFMNWSFMLLPLIFCGLSYFYYHKKLKETT